MLTKKVSITSRFYLFLMDEGAFCATKNQCYVLVKSILKNHGPSFQSKRLKSMRFLISLLSSCIYSVFLKQKWNRISKDTKYKEMFQKVFDKNTKSITIMTSRVTKQIKK